MSLRHRIAPLVRHAYRWLAPRRRGFRSVILHHVPSEWTPALEDLLDYIGETYGFIAPADAERVLAGDEAALGERRTPWLITFDDGFASDVEIARNVLAPRGIQAIFFVCPGLIDRTAGTQQTWVEDYLFPGGVGRPAGVLPRIVTWDEVRSLRDAGHTIGSHSLLHRRLSQLAAGDVSEDVGASADRISAELGGEPRWFAYPFGDVASISAGALEAIGRRFSFCCSGVRGRNTPATPRLAILRDSIDLAARRDYQRLVVDGGLDLFHRSNRKALAAMVSRG